MNWIKMWTVRTKGIGSKILVKDYQKVILLKLIEEKEPRNSRFFYDHCIETLGAKAVSRSSVIFFLNDLVEYNYVQFKSVSGKGGFHRMYWTDLDLEQMQNQIIHDVNESLKESINAIFIKENIL